MIFKNTSAQLHEESSITSLKINGTYVSVALDELDAQIKSMMTKTGRVKLNTCNVCGKEGRRSLGMPRHIALKQTTSQVFLILATSVEKFLGQGMVSDSTEKMNIK